MGSYVLSHLHMFGGGIVGYVIPFLFVLSLWCFSMSLGTFWLHDGVACKFWCFPIGFGPEIARFQRSLRHALENIRHPARRFRKVLWRRECCQRAGSNAGEHGRGPAGAYFHVPARAQTHSHRRCWPAANFVLAVIIFACVFALYGKQTMSARVDTVQPGSAAAAAGFQPGDLVVAIDGHAVDSFSDMQRIVSTSAGETLSVTVEHDGVQRVLKATPALKEVKDNFGNVQRIGILGITRSMAAEDLKLHPVAPPQAVWMALQETWSVIDRTLSYIGRGLSGREAASQLGGPIRIAQMSGQVASFGFVPLIQLAAVLSVSIGLLNLFPIPLLDGGHLLFYIIEGVRGRPLRSGLRKSAFASVSPSC